MRRKLAMPTDESNEEGSRKRKGLGTCLKDAYGCVAWQPELPSGENEQTQKQKKDWLIAENEKAVNSRDTLQTLKLMAETYASQRFMINQTILSVSQIFAELPFLLSTAGLVNHFNTLLGFDLIDHLQRNFATKGRLVVEHALLRGNKQVKVIAAMLEARSKIMKNDIPLEASFCCAT